MVIDTTPGAQMDTFSSDESHCIHPPPGAGDDWLPWLPPVKCTTFIVTYIMASHASVGMTGIPALFGHPSWYLCTRTRLPST